MHWWPGAGERRDRGAMGCNHPKNSGKTWGAGLVDDSKAGAETAAEASLCSALCALAIAGDEDVTGWVS